GDVRAAAIAVFGAAAVIDRRVPGTDAAAEVVVGGADAGIDHVDAHVRRRGVGLVLLVQRQVALVDAVQTPGGATLHGAGMNPAVLFDVGHALIGQQLCKRLVVRRHDEAGQDLAVAHFHLGAVGAGQLGGDSGDL